MQTTTEPQPSWSGQAETPQVSLATIYLQVDHNTDPLAILGLSSEITEVELKAAYRSLALRLHPDKCSAEQHKLHTALFQKVQDAYFRQSRLDGFVDEKGVIRAKRLQDTPAALHVRVLDHKAALRAEREKAIATKQELDASKEAARASYVRKFNRDKELRDEKKRLAEARAAALQKKIAKVQRAKKGTQGTHRRQAEMRGTESNTPLYGAKKPLQFPCRCSRCNLPKSAAKSKAASEDVLSQPSSRWQHPSVEEQSETEEQIPSAFVRETKPEKKPEITAVDKYASRYASIQSIKLEQKRQRIQEEAESEAFKRAVAAALRQKYKKKQDKPTARTRALLYDENFDDQRTSAMPDQWQKKLLSGAAKSMRKELAYTAEADRIKNAMLKGSRNATFCASDEQFLLDQIAEQEHAVDQQRDQALARLEDDVKMYLLDESQSLSCQVNLGLLIEE